MPNLIETYARSTGLKIDRPWLKQDFWPLPFDLFITLSAGSGQAAKNFDHWQLVIDFLNPILGPRGIHIVQLGDKDTPLFSGTYDLRGKMNIAQSTNLIKRARAHMGNDSWSAHAAGAIGTPLCAVYGTTDKVLHGPHWKDDSKTILLESHRWGRKPTFGAEGHPKSVNLIPPEDVANAVLKLLGLTEQIDQRTQLIGSLYQHTIFDWVPNAAPCLSLGPDVPISVRMDLVHSEQNLLAILQSGRKVTIVTKAPINLQVLAPFRANILSYSHEVDAFCPLDYTLNIKRLLSNVVFFSREKDEATLSALRYQFFDVCQIEYVPYATKTDFLRERALYLNLPLDNLPNIDTMMMRTNKFIMSNGKLYLSYAHEAADKWTVGVEAHATQVIDEERLWRDSAHYIIYQPI